jgi:hypothetical protein
MKYLVWLIPAFLSVNSVNAQQPRPDSQSVLDARAQRGDMNDFDAANQKFVQAARASNREALLDTLSPATKKDSATTLNKFLENVVSYFADFEQPISCTGITMVKDETSGTSFTGPLRRKKGRRSHTRWRSSGKTGLSTFPMLLRHAPSFIRRATGTEHVSSNSALLTDAFSSLRCAYGAAKRER